MTRNSTSRRILIWATKARAESFIILKRLRIGGPSNRWARDSLCDSTRGDIGLAWGIFKTRGSPNQNNWLVSVVGLLTEKVISHLRTSHFLSLPDANKLSFLDVQPIELPSIVLNLPSSALQHDIDTKTHMPSEMMSPTPIDLVHRFLVFEPSQCLCPSNALAHPWLTSKPLLIPDDYPTPSSQCNTPVTRWGGRDSPAMARLKE